MALPDRIPAPPSPWTSGGRGLGGGSQRLYTVFVFETVADDAATTTRGAGVMLAALQSNEGWELRGIVTRDVAAIPGSPPQTPERGAARCGRTPPLPRLG